MSLRHPNIPPFPYTTISRSNIHAIGFSIISSANFKPNYTTSNTTANVSVPQYSL